MAHFHYDATSYPVIPTAGGFDPSLFLNMAPVVDERESQEPTPLDDYWGMVEQPLSQWAGPSTSSSTLANHDSTVPTRTDGHSLPSYPGQCQWGSQPQPRPTSLWEDVSGVASGTFTVLPAPNGVPLSPRGNNASELYTNTPDSQNTCSWDQLSIDPTVSQLIPTRWLQIYGPTSSYAVGHVNAEAGPSTLFPPQDVGLPTQQPPGGISEMTTDVKNQKDTEENKVPRSKRRMIVYPRKPSRKYRNEADVYTPRLWAWVKKQKGSDVPRNFNDALAAAVGVISVIRPLIYASPHLAGGALSNKPPGTARVERGRNRRAAERKLYEDLSRRYPRKRSPWASMELLAKVVEDLETHPALQ